MNTAIYTLDSEARTASPMKERWMEELGYTEPQHLEEWLASTGPDLFGRRILWIGRQDRSSDDQRSDLVGIDDVGNVVLAELKRGIVQPGAVTQAVTYAAEYARYTADDLTRLFLDHSNKGGRTALVEVAESEEDAAQRLSDHLVDDTELNGSQILVLVGEDFNADVLAVCEYLTEASGNATFSLECWRARIFQGSETQLYLALEQVLPQPSVREAIEERREQAKAKKRTRDPARRRFVSELLTCLRENDINASRSQGQSYGFRVDDLDAKFDFSKGTDHPLVILSPECRYQVNAFPETLGIVAPEDHEGKGGILKLTAITRGDEYSDDIGRAMLTLLRGLSALGNEDSGRSERRLTGMDPAANGV